MNTRPLAILSILVFIGTTLWLVFMLAGGAPVSGFDAALAKVSQPDMLFTLTYLNAALLVTLPATALMAAISGYAKAALPEWAARLAFVFIPVYCILNLVVYLSQITLVPQLVQMAGQPETRLIAETLLRLTLQELPGSAASFYNGLAYALLGIPSVVYGVGIYRLGSRPRKNGVLQTGAVLLLLNGAACMLGLVGYLAVNALSLGVVIGGGLFWAALIFLAWGFFKQDPVKMA